MIRAKLPSTLLEVAAEDGSVDVFLVEVVPVNLDIPAVTVVLPYNLLHATKCSRSTSISVGLSLAQLSSLAGSGHRS